MSKLGWGLKLRISWPPSLVCCCSTTKNKIKKKCQSKYPVKAFETEMWLILRNCRKRVGNINMAWSISSVYQNQKLQHQNTKNMMTWASKLLLRLALILYYVAQRWMLETLDSSFKLYTSAPVTMHGHHACNKVAFPLPHTCIPLFLIHEWQVLCLLNVIPTVSPTLCIAWQDIIGWSVEVLSLKIWQSDFLKHLIFQWE